MYMNTRTLFSLRVMTTEKLLICCLFVIKIQITESRILQSYFTFRHSAQIAFIGPPDFLGDSDADHINLPTSQHFFSNSIHTSRGDLLLVLSPNLISPSHYIINMIYFYYKHDKPDTVHVIMLSKSI